MSKLRETNRELKQKIADCLSQDDFVRALEELSPYGERRLINPLFSFLSSQDEHIKWRAVTGMGLVTTRLASDNMEGARIIMRRLMWNLNDESGGIGWGSPESMAEIMARQEQLAREYHAILISYITPGGNYLEHEGLQPGALWGLGRLARSRPGLLPPIASLFCPYLESKDVRIRGHAAWASGAFNDPALNEVLQSLEDDRASFSLYQDLELQQVTVGEIALAGLDFSG